MLGFESLFWRGIRLQRRCRWEEEKQFLGTFFLKGLIGPNLGARNKAAQARQAKTNQTQIKGSMWSQMASSESGSCRA